MCVRESCLVQTMTTVSNMNISMNVWCCEFIRSFSDLAPGRYNRKSVHPITWRWQVRISKMTLADLGLWGCYAEHEKQFEKISVNSWLDVSLEESRDTGDTAGWWMGLETKKKNQCEKQFWVGTNKTATRAHTGLVETCGDVAKAGELQPKAKIHHADTSDSSTSGCIMVCFIFKSGYLKH